MASTVRVSVASSGSQANASSRIADISADGSVIVFSSTATNLVADDTNGVEDVFVYERASGVVTRVSVSSTGAQGNAASLGPAVSGDGRWVAFDSSATNLVASDTNAVTDVFLHDRSTGATVRVSMTSSGQQAASRSFGKPLLSFDARYVVFNSFAELSLDGSSTGLASAYRFDRTTGAVESICIRTDGAESRLCIGPSISDDGRYVAFESDATALVVGDTNNRKDIFVRDMVARSTVRASVSSSGAQANEGSLAASISGDGRTVAFTSDATNLVSGDTNATRDVFVRDLATATTERVSVGPSGAEANGGSHTRSENTGSRTVSSNGRYIAFESFASNLVNEDTNGLRDVFVFDRTTSLAVRVSIASVGTQADSSSAQVSLSGDGAFVAFESFATNLVDGDTNGVRDIFSRNWQGTTGDFGSAHAPTFGGQRPWYAYSKDPVNLATGVFTAEAEDLSMPGRVLGLAFTRWYNSADTTTGPLGPAWNHAYNWTLADGGSTVDVRRGDGRRDTFTRNPDGTYADPPNVFDVLVKNADSSYTLTLTNQVRHEFSSAGQLTRIQEPAGNAITLAYTAGNLTTITDSVGRAVTLGYDAANRLTQLQDPLGRRVIYAYDAQGRLASVTDRIGNAAGQDPNLHRWQYAYDGPTQHLASITDPDGRVRVRNAYDAQGRVFEQRDGLGALTTISYGTLQTTVSDPRGHPSTYTFDSRMRVLSQTDVVGANTYTLTYTYDAAGNRTSVTDRTGQRTDLTYDARGNVLTKADPAPAAGQPRPVTTFEYDPKNNLTRIVDPRGFATEMSYDPATNGLQSVRRQVDAATWAVTTYDYADAANPGLPTRIVAPRGNTGPTPDPTYATVLAYDAQGNLSSRTDPDGARTTFAYDGAGRLVSFVDPDGNAAGGVPAEHTWAVAYDENDRETSRTDPLGNVLRYSYDGAGNRTSLTDRNGNVTSYAYDANARLASVQQKPDAVGQPALVYTTTVTRDGNGNATRITQANGVVTDYAFDGLDRLNSVTTHPDAQTDLVTTYLVDGNGQPTSRTTGDGLTVAYAYDALSRLTSVTGPSLSITYAYDAAGHRTAMVDATGTTTYHYDGLGRVLQIAAPNGTLTYAYDLDGNRTTFGYPGGDNVTYQFSPGGRVTTVTDWGNRTTGYTYGPSGLATAVSYPNGMTSSYEYDRAQRLTAVTNSVAANNVTRHSYGLDAEGNRTSLEEELGAGCDTVSTMGHDVASAASHCPPPCPEDPIDPPTCLHQSSGGVHNVFTYQYDGLDRLVLVTRNGSTEESFAFDGATNITSRTGPSASYSHDDANRVTSDATRIFIWGGADRLVQRGSDTFAYDPLGRMTGATVARVTRGYSYDGDGLLQSRSDAATTRFLWDASSAPAPLLEVGSDRVVHGLGPLYMVRADGSSLSFARDGLGSIRAEVDDFGQINRAFRYAAYGAAEIISETSPEALGPTVLGFAGELTDPSGLVYLRARWYDPVLGKFMSRDPFNGSAEDPASQNLYAYAHANPTRFTDPTGNCPFCLVIGVGAIAGATINASIYIVGSRQAGDFTWGGLAGAAVTGAVIGGAASIAGPAGGTFGGALAAGSINAFAGGVGYGAGLYTANAVDSVTGGSATRTFSVGAMFAHSVGAVVGGPLGDKVSPMVGVHTLRQLSLFAPRTWAGFMRQGTNMQALEGSALVGGLYSSGIGQLGAHK